MSPGVLLVISGPSGVGKGTICRALLDIDPKLYLSVSVTTRVAREGEREGRDYFFISEGRFQELRHQNELLEWAQVYDYYYATPRKVVMEARAAGRDAILEIDVQGGFQVRKNCPDSILIFVMPPSLEELGLRLKNRGTETGNEVDTRLKWAEKELCCFSEYDYVVVNDRVEDAVAKINAIRVAEKCRPQYCWLFDQEDCHSLLRRKLIGK